jgi:hypothetical protein
MTEAEAIYQISYFQELLFSVMQWWLGVSIGLLALGRFFSEKLNLFVLILLVAAYVMYTLFVVDNVRWIFENQASLVVHLENLRDGSGITAAGQAQIETSRRFTFGETWGFTFSAAILFLGSISYLVYGYIQVRRKSTR